MWESAVSIGTDTPFYFYLYRDRTGARVSKGNAPGEPREFRIPPRVNFYIDRGPAVRP